MTPPVTAPYRRLQAVSRADASEGTEPSVVRALLAAPSIDADTRDVFGLAPLHKATGFGKAGLVSLLATKVPVDSLTAEVTAPSRQMAQRSQRETALHIATRGGRDAALSALLRHGADRSIRNIHGDVPLHCAAKSGGWRQARALLCSRGRGDSPPPPCRAQLDATNVQGLTPPGLAAGEGRILLAAAMRTGALCLVPDFLEAYLSAGSAGMSPAEPS